jgi:hypothetical protein
MACELGRQVVHLRDSGRFDAASIVEHARLGGFLAEFKRVSARGRRGQAFSYPQCDAAQFLLEAVVPVADSWENEVLGSLLCDEQGAERSTTAEAVFGMVLRRRIICDCCDYVSARLEILRSLKLGFPSGCTKISLAELLELYFSEHSLSTHDAAGVACRTDGARTQYFLEKEPSVLVMQLHRHVGDGLKVTAEVSFPEELLMLRTGKYHLAGVIQHVGHTADMGHYVCTMWLGQDKYALYDDELPVQEKTWSYLTQPDVRSQAYVLLYVRGEPLDPDVVDGTERTPYVRDRHSLELSQRRVSADRGQASLGGSGRSQSPHGSGDAAAVSRNELPPLVPKRRRLLRKTSTCSSVGDPASHLPVVEADAGALHAAAEPLAARRVRQKSCSVKGREACSSGSNDHVNVTGLAAVEMRLPRRLSRKSSLPEEESHVADLPPVSQLEAEAPQKRRSARIAARGGR